MPSECRVSVRICAGSRVSQSVDRGSPESEWQIRALHRDIRPCNVNFLIDAWLYRVSKVLEEFRKTYAERFSNLIERSDTHFLPSSFKFSNVLPA